MNKRIFIRKLAIPAASIAAVSILVLLALIPINHAQFENHKDESKKYINSFMDQNTKYLKGIAFKIKSIQPDPNLISEMQSEYVVEHQKADQPKRYVWMTSTGGDFLFGVPAEDFQKLSVAFEKYQGRIKTDDFYRDRNDFFMKLIDNTKRIDFLQFDRDDRSDRRYWESNWRFYEGDNFEDLLQAPVSSFVAPVYDGTGKVIGRLFMKVDDRVNIEKYLGESKFEISTMNEGIRVTAIAFLVFSGIFLWFLLPTWVYVDARERDVKTPGVWAFLALTSLVFGLTIYLITRPNSLKTFTCPQCKGDLNGTRAYCPHCGYDLSSNFCQQCQYPIDPEWKFCPDCRAVITVKASQSKKERAQDAPQQTAVGDM